ncbi:MAG: hypothetical protein EYC68_19965 [Chloroflexota bacterium]|nr:MAG: hypothetical protein EYC68_19965 [Chloroflexota bacterium]
MGYGVTDSGGTKVIVVSLAVLVVVAFGIGGILLGNLQGFIPGIVEQRVREGQIANDRSAEDLRHTRAQNAQAEKNAADAAENQKAWDEMILDVVREGGMQTTGALPWIVIIAALALAVRFVAPSLRVARAVSAEQMATPHDIAAPPTDSDDDTVMAHYQSPSEKEAHRFERELARKRERRERALALRTGADDRSNGNRRAA